ncbi:CBS domain containing-hemolysin-like protein [Dysgonomonas alginatilytica]|uniref:CBS domain containing-hemolysin-like protein n=1 Tax=Dysgonomonas alginatilytica TaxID=1605892 RepID=A0A2V3PP61_9BACT|nr:hemolysin family protein [Dysgonomonas alginatilytica]PXV63129.1 CBS domain containing-hemolysin-like protein [Dysgonomonas alginatilytica]
MISNILITLLFVFFNGFFVAAEFAIVKVRSSQLELKAQEGNRFAILSKHIVSHLDAYLAATQLGITLSSLALGWIGEPVVSKMIMSFMELVGINVSPELAHSIALPVAFLIITILHIVFGELAPKSLAILRPEQTTLFISYPLQGFYWICRPFIWLLNGFANLILKMFGLHTASEAESYSSDELKYLVDQVRESGHIEDSNYDIIRNAFDFSERTARQVMVPRTQVLAIDVNDYDAETLETVIEDGFSRIPCYEDSIDNIIGIVHLKDILKKMRQNGEVDIRPIVRPVSFVPETKRIGQILKEFQIKHQQIAMVLNEYGGIEGIITMEDILEELVGEIQDEYDNEIPFVEKISDNIYSVIATAAISDINNQLPHSIDKAKQYDTLAGYLIDKFGRIPNTHDKLEAEGYEFSVLKKNKTSIVLVQLVDLESQQEDSTSNK